MRRRLGSYQLRLFLPIVGIIWLLIGIFAILQFTREREYRRDTIRQQADLITQRSVDLLEQNRADDAKDFIDFIGQYFNSDQTSAALNEVSVAIYNRVNGDSIKSIGFDAPPPANIHLMSGEITGHELNDATEEGEPFENGKALYYKEASDSDSTYVVQVILPSKEAQLEVVNQTDWWWSVILVGGIVMTIIVYLTTRHLTRNVALLKKFASDAVNDVDFTATETFPNDDLGEISRQIIEIYKSRKNAQVTRDIEHRMVLRATEEKANIKRELTNNISHELKTPVGIVRGYLETMLENPDMDDKARQLFTTKAYNQALRLCTLLDDLSMMTRLEEASTKIKLESVDFNKFLDEIAIDVEESGVTNGMVFFYDIPDPCYVKGNTSLLTGVIMNLIKNAANYSKGSEISIELLTQNQRFYTFSFRDNGTGVEPEHLPHLFERFYRVDKGRSRKVGGTGLGLPIVKSSIATMGGSITVRNHKDGGLEFIFTLSIANPGPNKQ